MKSAVEMPAAPQLNPSDFWTTFCSFRLFPAQTKVMGIVMTSKVRRRSSTENDTGLLHNLAILVKLDKRPD